MSATMFNAKLQFKKYPVTLTLAVFYKYKLCKREPVSLQKETVFSPYTNCTLKYT